jgi:gas vesicle protein
MGGLAVGLITGRRELVAGVTGAVIGVAVALAWDPSAGIIAGGVIGPLAGILIKPGGGEHHREGQLAFGPEPAHDHEDAVPFFPQRSGHAPGDPEARGKGSR